MLCLRRLVLSDRLFFVTCKVFRGRQLGESEFALLAGVIQSRRKTHHFLLTAWVSLSDYWSSIHDYSGTVGQVKSGGSVLPIDRILLPADQRARI